jgi:hypothetical protein
MPYRGLGCLHRQPPAGKKKAKYQGSMTSKQDLKL